MRYTKQYVIAGCFVPTIARNADLSASRKLTTKTTPKGSRLFGCAAPVILLKILFAGRAALAPRETEGTK